MTVNIFKASCCIRYDLLLINFLKSTQTLQQITKLQIKGVLHIFKEMLRMPPENCVARPVGQWRDIEPRRANVLTPWKIAKWVNILSG